MKKLLQRTMLLLFALIAGSTSLWATDPVPTATATSGKSYVVAYYANNKYYALPHGSSSGVWDGTEVTLNGINKVNTTTAENLAWTLTEGTTSGQFYLTYPSGNTTKYLTKSGSTGDNKNLNVVQSSGNDHYWEFTLNSGNSDYTVKSLKSITANTTGSTLIYLGYATAGKFGVYAQASAAKIILLEIGDDPNATPTCATPTISPASGAVLSGTEISLTTTTEGASIRYTMGDNPDDPTASSTLYDPDHKPTITAATTIKAIAVKQGYDNSTIASASYTIATPFANIAALTAETTAGTKYVTLSNATVTYVNGNYAYIQDASGAVVLYKSSHGLTAGDVLNGTATVAYQLKNQNPQITEISGVTKTSGDAPSPTEVAQSAWNYTFNNVLSQYFKITGASIFQSNDKYYVSLGDDDVQLYKVGGSLSISDLAKKFTIIGFPTLYNTTKELQIFTAPAEEVSSDPIIAANPTVLNDFVYEVGAGPSEAKTISVSGSSLTGNITISMASGSNYEMSLSENDGYTNYLSLTPTTGTVAATTIYVRMKSGLTIGNYPGSITVASAGVTDNIVIGLSGNVTPHYTTWDLSTNAYASASADLVTWTSDYAMMTLAKGTSSTAANNFLGGGSNAHTRIYKDQVLTIAPLGGYKIKYVEITGINSYIDGFTGNAWTNGATTVTTPKVKITPSDSEMAPMSVVISAACRATEVKVYYDQVPSTNIAITSTCTDGTKYYATYSSDQAFFVPANLTVSEIKVVGGQLSITNYEPGECVPGNTGVMVSSASAGNIPVSNAASGTSKLGEDNMLKPTSTAMTGSYKFYRLTMHNGTQIGFYWGAANGAAFDLGANKAYLAVPTGSTAPEFLGFNFNGETTSINEVQGAGFKINGYYDLQGRKVANPTKGLYIVNGKKVVIK